MRRADWTIGKERPAIPIPNYAKEKIGTKWKGESNGPDKGKLADFQIVGWTPYECDMTQGKGYKVKLLDTKQKGEIYYYPEYWLTDKNAYNQMMPDARTLWKRLSFFPRPHGQTETISYMMASYLIWYGGTAIIIVSCLKSIFK